jgi:hypothetical protein
MSWTARSHPMRNAAVIFLLLAACFAWHKPVYAITRDQAQQIARTCASLAPACRRDALASITGDVVTISLYSHPGASADDLKIDAILLARLIMQADTAGVNRVVVQFYELKDRNRYSVVEIGKTDIEAYTKAGVDKSVMLGSISVHKEATARTVQEILAAKGVKQGAALAGRLSLFANLEIMVRERIFRPTEANACTRAFDEIEKMAATGAGEDLLVPKINTLNQLMQRVHDEYGRAAAKVSAGARQPGQTGSATPGATGSQAHSQAEFNRLCSKYPYFKPYPYENQWRHRVLIASELMRRAEQGQNVEGWRSTFAKLELLASRTDATSARELTAALSEAESRLGMSSTAPSSTAPGGTVDTTRTAGGPAALQAASGPEFERRTAVAAAIARMSGRGTDVSSLATQFRYVESLVPRQDPTSTELLRKRLKILEMYLGLHPGIPAGR